MAEHEKEMQRQMMSVPPIGVPNSMSVPPPGMGAPSGPPPSLMSLPTQQNPNWLPDDANENVSNELPSLMAMKVDKPDDVTGSKSPTSNSVVLPKALEDVFAFKDQLTDELGRKDGEIPVDIQEKPIHKSSTAVISTEYADVDVDSDEDDYALPTAVSVSRVQIKVDKNKKKKKRKKQNRQQRQAAQRDVDDKRSQDIDKSEKDTNELDEDVTIEYVPDKITIAELAPMYRQFYSIFEIFKLEDKHVLAKDSPSLADEKLLQAKKEKDKQMEEEDEEIEDEKKDDKEKLSKRKLKKLTRLSVAELKQLVHRPDVVEMHDVTARDPKLLVQLKAHRNTVQVPRHWCFKRKYLQGKRGIEKPPFDLPAFIKKTGIMEMRASLQEKDEAKTLKAKMRERARPKMGKIDIDYQKLHDAFFK